MRFPHPCRITPSIEDPDTGQRVPDPTQAYETKGFFLPSSSSEAIGAGENETGQRETEYWHLFLPPTTPEFDSWATVDWLDTNDWQKNHSFEVQGGPKPFGGTKGGLHHVEVYLREVDHVG